MHVTLFFEVKMIYYHVQYSRPFLTKEKNVLTS